MVHPHTLRIHATGYRYLIFKRDSMSRKHYRAIANAIRENIELKSQREEVARALLAALKESNPRFDASRFMIAAVGE